MSAAGQSRQMPPEPVVGLFPLRPQKRTFRKRIFVMAITAGG
jgi:hypothetical protein